MTKKRFPYLAIAFVLMIMLQACKDKGKQPGFQMPAFPNAGHADVHLLTGELMANMANDIFEYGNYLYVIYYDRKSQAWCHVYDKHTGEALCDRFNMGNGPGEILTIPVCSSRGDRIFIYDLPVRKQISCPFASLRDENMSPEVSVLDIKPYARNACVYGPGGDESIVLNQIGYSSPDTIGYHRLVVKDVYGDTLRVHDFEPFTDPVEMFNLYTESLMSLDESGTHLAVGSVWGAIIEMYELPEFSQKAFLKLVDPALVYGSTPTLTADTKAGLRDLFATDDYLYAVIGADVSLLSNKDKESGKDLENNDVYVFDWTGKPVGHLETDYNIEKMCVTSSKDTIYAVVSDREERLYLGYLTDFDAKGY